MLQSLKKKNSLLKFWAQFSQNWPFGPKEDLWANFTSKIFIYLACTIMLQSLKKILRAYPERDIGLHNFQLSQNYSIGLKEEFWGSFTLTTFYLFIVLYHCAKFEKIDSSGSWDIGLDDFRPDQNCAFGGPKDFLGNFIYMIFIYLLHSIVEQSLQKNF